MFAALAKVNKGKTPEIKVELLGVRHTQSHHAWWKIYLLNVTLNLNHPLISKYSCIYTCIIWDNVVKKTHRSTEMVPIWRVYIIGTTLKVSKCWTGFLVEELKVTKKCGFNGWKSPKWTLDPRKEHTQTHIDTHHAMEKGRGMLPWS